MRSSPGRRAKTVAGLRYREVNQERGADSSFFMQIHVYRNGQFRTAHERHGSTLELPGALSQKLWLGLSFGRAEQFPGVFSGVIGFRPLIWFQRSTPAGNIRGEFATAQDLHYLYIDSALLFPTIRSHRSNLSEAAASRRHSW